MIMTDERELHPSEDTRQRESSEEYLWRVLKPVGCILVLLLMISMLVFCFTYRPPAEGEAAPEPAVSETAGDAGQS